MDVIRGNNSIKSKIVKKFIKLSNYKNNTSSIENTKKYIERCNKKNIKELLYSHMIKKDYNNNEYFLYNNNKKSLLFYVHGGSFVENVLGIQIKFMKKLSKKINSDLLIQTYQTLPKGNASITMEQTLNLYKNMLNKYDNIYLVGDSAGGGIVLSLSMEISYNKISSPKAIILLSPWIDLTLSNKKIRDVQDKDIVCSIEGNKYCGKLWAEKLDVRDYRVSAIYGDVSNLNNIFISSSKNEICNPDCNKFVLKLKKNSIKYKYVEFINQFHNFELYSIKESNILLEDIYNFIQEVLND